MKRYEKVRLNYQLTEEQAKEVKNKLKNGEPVIITVENEKFIIMHNRVKGITMNSKNEEDMWLLVEKQEYESGIDVFLVTCVPWLLKDRKKAEKYCVRPECKGEWSVEVSRRNVLELIERESCIHKLKKIRKEKRKLMCIE